MTRCVINWTLWNQLERPEWTPVSRGTVYRLKNNGDDPPDPKMDEQPEVFTSREEAESAKKELEERSVHHFSGSETAGIAPGTTTTPVRYEVRCEGDE